MKINIVGMFGGFRLLDYFSRGIIRRSIHEHSSFSYAQCHDHRKMKHAVVAQMASTSLQDDAMCASICVSASTPRDSG